ncbi:undecaprenyldiphospho-muramoylpentapeptide beta-N-acetylglucosaminyltransferase [Paenibacillus abyssi]|uniref:UDP-N-acetylglucosamine--N-acetylmuramyl-(pentapeptide) pyrophosphoryl-undecaprenol N-acetylglucosamine transferase n=1 Tax=Paenibacillus abyssi TaxID=1340531 RepID=A0A917FWQ3_9BACL|nr:undecaprenyldiphospho-muramoylpentapeptide beta-N-acetylglucosaminyltransferase [Paenibacillus abyssi]GGG10235.1 UDP-N-acetylglucosamine--N-acetylmuramyl-(pentapeptide) pyrophosphoryl-undecaprenol N-acetylglucosamine transferase 1 [Paenibacillus abyssi]
MRIVLTGGGTGGHIYPAVAVGKQIQEEVPETSLLYIGTERGLESRIVPAKGIPFEAIDITGFKRKLSIDNARTILRFIKGVKRSKQLLREFKPDAVVGTGGYVCGPVVYAAAKLGIPTLIHEQNVIPGLTNKFLSRYADLIAVSFEASTAHFNGSKRVIYTGNPCATQVLRAEPEKGCESLGLPAGSKIVLIVGGSRGAKAINDAMLSIVPELNRFPDIHFVFVTGETYHEQILRHIAERKLSGSGNLHIRPYLHNMAQVLAAALLIVSRSGASSIAEITALGVPSILIPSPNVTNNHQEPNARRLADAGAAEMVLERDLTGALLLDKLECIIGNEDRLKKMSNAASALGMPESARMITGELLRLCSGR